MTRKILYTSLIWLFLIVISFLWNYHQAKLYNKRIAFQTAKNIFNLIVITRRWNACIGGVYGKVSNKLKPNPYLNIPLRDINVNDNLKLTLINPAYMTRQISEVAKNERNIFFHITSLKPIRPENKPTPLEEKFLKEFNKGLKEKGVFVKKDGKNYFFYMSKLNVEPPCLKCHFQFGYKEGDIIGGISVTIPFSKNFPILPLVLGHLLIACAGFLAITIGGNKLNKAYNKIEEQALIDSLTNIPNRRHLNETIIKEFKRSKRYNYPLSIIICDIDNFKAFNDTYGHLQGDICLKKVANQIKSSLKRPEDFCARFGGEEFIVILPKTKQEGAVKIAENIRKNIVKLNIPHKNNKQFKIVTISAGVATSIDTNSLNSYEQLVKYADIALYAAKDKGKNRVELYTEYCQLKNT